MTSSPIIIRSVDELRQSVSSALERAQEQAHQQATEEQPATPVTLGYVATMGALHEGHATLIRRAREQNDVVVVSVFVNPLQFGPGEDYEKYPRTLESDVQVAQEAGADIVFAPDNDQMYPSGTPLITVSSGKLGNLFEGKTRPGHFDGALTVVNKFFNILKSGARHHVVNAYFGRKDAQQVSLIQRMVQDFNHDIVIKPVPIVRADDGLALSSRNQYLSAEDRERALVLSRTLAMLREQQITRGLTEDDISAARERIDAVEGVRLDYLEVIDSETFEPPAADSSKVLALVAAYVGQTRLIDNMELN
ncbi:pantoate--beta-alanine ligase [Rothia sp. P7181]|uniref:pantoate--beta-alanine ligase n=1 Tax=unclassified Rothia (in: high G+C Gram-positive bacteria) TaxID=2689056 RepID=UPI003AC3C597